ncbi:hypothetical protein HZH68_011804 [Vespula germanica]|uniref:NADH dehydrogenase [ubiquinone] 1 alpha subcomplex subunit 4 n=1 Tax=Vespula germanica TaxID=30212 RepID=A0A834JKY2_VESGE|nr:hypothetical protein HZH68_011804 [Vespula germanica]
MGDSNAKKGPILGGLTFSSLKKNYPASMGGATFYTLRLAFRNPDVTWSLKNNPEPWEEYRDKQYKFYSSVNYKDHTSKAPEF